MPLLPWSFGKQPLPKKISLGYFTHSVVLSRQRGFFLFFYGGGGRDREDNCFICLFVLL